jgi:hypothetical protein
MSAFVVGKAHLDYILTFGLLDAGRNPLTWLVPLKADMAGRQWKTSSDAEAAFLRRKRQLIGATADAVGLMLLEQNIRSVNCRYSLDDRAETMYAFEPSDKRPYPVQALKALQCYEYQACEDPDWENSEARAFWEALRRRAIGSLPGYEQAAWEIR